MKSAGWVLAVLTILIPIQLLGCGRPPEVSEIEVNTVSPTARIDAASATPSRMNEIDVTRTPKGTVQETDTPSPAVTLTPSLTPTATATFTPLPTLDPISAQNRVLELLRSNGDCSFPCWWGLIPGITSWEETKHLLSPFAESIWPNRDTASIYQIKFSVPEAINKYGFLNVNFDLDENRGIKLISAGKEYPLNEFLTDYGQPDQIYIWAISAYTLSPEARYTIALYYEGQGILVAYDGSAEKAETLQICPSSINQDNTYFWLWDPARETSFEEVWDSDLIFNPIDDVTNISVLEFFERYRQSENLNQCFEMPDPDL